MASDKRAARLGVLAAVAVLLFGALGVRLWFLQTVEATELQDSVQVERTKTVRLVPERGRIFDADGRILADNERILTVGIDWEMMQERDDRRELFRRLSGWLDVPVAEMERRYNANVYSPYLPMPVKEDVDERTANALLERSEDFPGVRVENDWRRAYPYAPLASPVIGYMGLIPGERAEEYEQNGYVLNEEVGRDGIELSMEETLHGRWGEVVYRVNAAGQILDTISYRAPVNGRDLQLSIDLDVQQYAEQILQTQLKLRRTFTADNPIITKEDEGGIRERIDPFAPDEVPYKAPAGSVIVTNQQNGQISAMATYPTFDHRWFNADISGEKFAELFPGEDTEGFDPDTATLVNRAVQGQYNLGSTFKPFTAYAALHSGFMEPESFYEDQGSYRMRSIDDATCASGEVRCEFRNSTCGDGRPCVYGSVNTFLALAVSSDAFFYRIGEELFLREENLLRDEVERWGFGRETGVDLPYEFDGRVADDQLKQDLIESGALDPETDVDRLLAGDNVQTAIGQGLLAASPMQLAQAYAALGNLGVINQPHVVRAIYEPGVPNGGPGYADLRRGKLVESYLDGEVTGQVPIEADDLQALVGGLRRNITGPGVVLSDGVTKRSTTAEELFAIGYPEQAIPVAGKTGTAQGQNSLPWNDSSAFAAFSIDDTRPYTVVSYLEKAGFGSQGSAPVVKCMYLALSGLIPTRPVELADPLDLDSTEVAADAPAADTDCLESSNFDPTPAD